MSQWQSGDGFGSVSPQSRELHQSWTNQEENQSRASAEAWGPQQSKASSFHYVPDHQLLYARAAQAVNEAPLSARYDAKPVEAPLATRIEMNNGNERVENHYTRHEAVHQESKESTPLSCIYDILDVHSQSSRWLEQRGYLESFKSPNCTLDLTFGTDARGSKIGAVVTAPDGTKRTVVSCEGGLSFQRLTAANGQELVKFLSSGQIVELNPSGRST